MFISHIVYFFSVRKRIYIYLRELISIRERKNGKKEKSEKIKDDEETIVTKNYLFFFQRYNY